jgi:hypothetical protein
MECIEQELENTKREIERVDVEIQRSKIEKNKKMMKSGMEKKAPLVTLQNSLEKE